MRKPRVTQRLSVKYDLTLSLNDLRDTACLRIKPFKTGVLNREEIFLEIRMKAKVAVHLSEKQDVFTHLHRPPIRYGEASPNKELNLELSWKKSIFKFFFLSFSVDIVVSN